LKVVLSHVEFKSLTLTTIVFSVGKVL